MATGSPTSTTATISVPMSTGTTGDGYGGIELTLDELQEMASRQQRQIDLNNQIIKAREERLKHLLYQFRNDSLNSTFGNQYKLNSDFHMLRNLKQAIDEYKLCNDCNVSDLEILGMICVDKEEEIKSVNKRIEDLNKQVEHFRRIRQQVDLSNDDPHDENNQRVDEVDRLRQELTIRNRLNEQQARRLSASKELYERKQKELLTIDARLLQLTERLCSHKFIPPKFTDVTFINAADDFLGNSLNNSDSERFIQKSPKMSFSNNSFQSSFSDSSPLSENQNCCSVPNLRIDDDKLNMHFNVINSVKKRHSITESENSYYAQIPIAQLRAKAEVKESISPSVTEQQIIIHDDTNSNEVTVVNNPTLKKVRFDPIAILLDAAVQGELDLVIQATKQLKDPSQPNDEGITALHNAVCAGNFHCVEYLVNCGCDINFADNDGWTPLHCAASCNNLKIIRFLVEHGAAIFAQTGNDFEIPEEKCEIEEDGYEECFEYLSDIRENIGILNDGLVYALYDHRPDNSDELELKVNQKLKIIRKGDSHEKEWWWAEDSNSSNSGYIPKNYLGLYRRVPLQIE